MKASILFLSLFKFIYLQFILFVCKFLKTGQDPDPGYQNVRIRIDLIRIRKMMSLNLRPYLGNIFLVKNYIYIYTSYTFCEIYIFKGTDIFLNGWVLYCRMQNKQRVVHFARFTCLGTQNSKYIFKLTSIIGWRRKQTTLYFYFGMITME